MTKHAKISYAKSALRMAACAVFIYQGFYLGPGLLALVEVLDIVEKFGL